MRTKAKDLLKKLKEPSKLTEPSLYQIAVSEMNKLVWYSIKEDMAPDKMAFATKTPGGVFKVFVNDKIPKKYWKYFKLHEYGHVLFGHLSNDELREKQFTRKIIQHWDKIKDNIEIEDEDQGKTVLELVKKYILPLQGVLQNYAMDMEVNSKLFPTDPERDEMKEVTSVALVRAMLNDSLILDAQLEPIEKWIDEGQKVPFAKPVYPADYNFPDQLSYQEYLDLMLIHADEFLKNLKQDANGQGNGQGQGQGQGNGQGQSSGQGNGQGSDGNSNGEGKKLSKADKKRLKKQLEREAQNAKGRLTLDDIEKLRKAAKNDTDQAENEKAASASGHGSEKEEDSSNTEDGEGSGSNDSSGEVGQGGGGVNADWSGQGGLGVGHQNVKRPDVIPLGNGRALAEFLEKEAFSKKVEHTRIDEMYYYNRRKYGEKDIVSKQNKEDVYRPGNLYIVVDCSGSIDRDAIRKMLDVIKNLSKKCGPKSRVIWWDTSLCGDYGIKAKQVPSVGGGTDIAGGIKYTAEKYLKKSNDKMIVISDYCDTLTKWYDVSKKFKNDITGICWVHGENGSTDQIIKNACYGCSNMDVKSFKRRIHTKIVDISK